MYYIYALIEPKTETYKYIGVSNNPSRRLTEHCRYPSNAKKERWINHLANKGLLPEVIILKSTKRKDLALQLEKKYIALHRKTVTNNLRTMGCLNSKVKHTFRTRERFLQLKKDLNIEDESKVLRYCINFTFKNLN